MDQKIIIFTLQNLEHFYQNSIFFLKKIEEIYGESVRMLEIRFSVSKVHSSNSKNFPNEKRKTMLRRPLKVTAVTKIVMYRGKQRNFILFR